MSQFISLYHLHPVSILTAIFQVDVVSEMSASWTSLQLRMMEEVVVTLEL